MKPKYCTLDSTRQVLLNIKVTIFAEGYTSISVREPLANIIAQTKQRPPRPLTDPHYATVSDDSGTRDNVKELLFF